MKPGITGRSSPSRSPWPSRPAPSSRSLPVLDGRTGCGAFHRHDFRVHVRRLLCDRRCCDAYESEWVAQGAGDEIVIPAFAVEPSALYVRRSAACKIQDEGVE